jgi:hypothetical protein
MADNPFRDTLQRYIDEAPSGFSTLGYAPGGAWTPTLVFPGAINTRGGGPDDAPFIESVLFSFKVSGAAKAKFADIVAQVEAVVPEWKKDDLTQFDSPRMFFGNGPTHHEMTASIDVAVVQLGDDYNVNLAVQTWTPD